MTPVRGYLRRSVPRIMKFLRIVSVCASCNEIARNLARRNKWTAILKWPNTKCSLYHLRFRYKTQLIFNGCKLLDELLPVDLAISGETRP